MKTNQEDKNVSTNFKVEGTRKAVEPLIKRQRSLGTALVSSFLTHNIGYKYGRHVQLTS